MFLVNSRQRYFRCGPTTLFPINRDEVVGQALSRTYGRFFAEFLNEESPVRLGLLDQSTCVGFRYGCVAINLDGFLGDLLCRISPALLQGIFTVLGDTH